MRATDPLILDPERSARYLPETRRVFSQSKGAFLRSSSSSSSDSGNLLGTTSGHVVTRMHRTAVSYTATFRISRGTTIETGLVVMMSALQELHAFLRGASPRRRQCRAADHRGDDVFNIVAIYAVIDTVPQERVQIMLVAGGRQIVNDAGRHPRRVDAGRASRGVFVVLADAYPRVVVLPAVQLTQIRFLMAPGRPTSTLPPSLRAQHRRASRSR